MAQYIPKSALVAEIERLRNDAHNGVSYHQSRQSVGLNNELSTWEHLENAFATVLKIIDTIEVKKVDLEKSVRHYLLHEHCSPLNEIMHQADLKAEIQYHKDIEHAYKAGFELGLKAQKGEEV